MNDLLDLKPTDLPTYAIPAWLSCLRYTLGLEDVISTYRLETGDTYKPPHNPLDAMIDQASGRDWQFLKNFVLWFNDNIWGEWNP